MPVTSQKLRGRVLSGLVALAALLTMQGDVIAGTLASRLRALDFSRSTVAVTLNPRIDDPFDQSTLRAPDGALWTKWRQVQSDAARDLDAVAACRADLINCYAAPALRFIELVELAKHGSGRDRLERVNRAINAAIRYSSDLTQHGVIDLWSSPLASLESERGDCEDYAIAKYYVLRSAGVPAGELRIVLVRDLDTQEYHAVLAARQDSEWLVLDNRRMTLLDSYGIQRLQPLFAVDDQGVQMFNARFAGSSRIAVATNR